MLSITDPVTLWALMILASVVMGTLLLIAVAFFRRWQQIRYNRYVHTLQRTYRPLVAKVLAGARSPADVEALRELGLADLELLLDPLFSKRKLPERNLVFLQALCVELGLADLWQSRLGGARSRSRQSSGNSRQKGFADRASMRHVLRAKSIRNLGALRYWPSWPLLVNCLNDRNGDIQMVALRSLGALAAPQSFPLLRQHLHASVQGAPAAPPLPVVTAAMANFDVSCAPELLPSLRHTDRQIRMHAVEILRSMVCRRAARQMGLALTADTLSSAVLELLLSEFSVDACAETRARTAEVLVYLDDPRALTNLRTLLTDQEWFVRLHAVRALAKLRQPALLNGDMKQCLRDPDWRVREGAIDTLIAFGREGRHQLFEYFLACSDQGIRKEIVERIERMELLPELMKGYSEGANGVDARVIEQLAHAAAPRGLPELLSALSPEIRQKFMDRLTRRGPSPGPMPALGAAEAAKAIRIPRRQPFRSPQAA